MIIIDRSSIFNLNSLNFLCVGITFDGSEDRSDRRRIKGSIPAAIENAQFLDRLDM